MNPLVSSIMANRLRFLQALFCDIIHLKMQTKRSRKKELARRTFVYSLMTISVIILAILLTLFMLGYRFDIEKRTIHPTGLVQYDSFPRGATVSVDGVYINTTKTKSTVNPGERAFSMELEGYTPWKKTLRVQSDTVTYLDYVRLVPKDRRIQTVAELSSVQSARFAPGGKWLVTITGDVKNPVVTWFDVRNPKKPKNTVQNIDPIKLSEYDKDGVTHELTIHEWDTSGRFVLVKHAYDSGDSKMTQWLKLDREKPTEATDISALAGLQFTNVTFAGTSGDVLYALQPSGELRELNIAQATISAPIITDVTSFSLYGEETISYISQKDGVWRAGIWKKGWKQPRIFRQVTHKDGATPQLTIRASYYFHKDTVAVGLGSEVKIYRGNLADSDDAISLMQKTNHTFQFNRPVSELVASDNGRFIVAMDGAGLLTYDLERLTASNPMALAPGEKISWLDSFHFQRRRADGSMVMHEFDGANEHQLMNNTMFATAFSEDQKYLMGIVRQGEKIVLQRLSMTIDND